MQGALRIAASRGSGTATSEDEVLGTFPSEFRRESLDGASVPSVAVVIPVYNRAGFLREALASVFGQTQPPQEVIVVDDGSDDDPASVVAEFPGVRLIRQENQGPSGARNTGIAAASSDFVQCLDSDDVFVPTALESNLACLAENPGVAFVYGGHLRVDEALQPIDRPSFTPMASFAYHDLLHNNYVHMLGTVLFDRAKLLAAGGFDPRIRRSEDYELFLRLARNHPIAGHPSVVAKYRFHNSNISARASEMVASALAAQELHRPSEGDAPGMRAYRRGKKILVRMYAIAAWRPDPHVARARKWQDRRAMARVAPLSSFGAAIWQFARRHLPWSVMEWLKKLLGRRGPGLGKVRLGDLKRTRPISWIYGYDRGTPIDRYYIEKFLAASSSAIHGRVLEIGDDTYSREFGSGITRQDVLHVRDDSPGATLTGDLAQEGLLPAAVFDCMIVTQTLQLIFDMKAALRELHRGLKPGGVLLATLPGIASADRGEFADSWYWSMTGQAAQRLFGEVFGDENVEVTAHGNVYAATCFLHGLALEEVEERWLDKSDASYPLVITVRARRADR